MRTEGKGKKERVGEDKKITKISHNEGNNYQKIKGKNRMKMSMEQGEKCPLYEERGCVSEHHKLKLLQNKKPP